jgi:hypothetical protein
LSAQSIISYLVESEGVDRDKFRSKGVQGDSLNSKTVLEPLLDNGYAQEFLDTYIEYSSVRARTNRATKVADRLVASDFVSKAGRALHKLHFTVGVQENLRFNYKNEDLISIPHEYSPCYSVEDDYFLVWGDYAQSDFRIAYNLFLRDEENAKIMDACEDKYEGIARVVAAHFKESFDLEKFKEERDLYKVYVLSTIYGQQHGRTPEAQEFISKFNKYLNTCAKYQEYIRRIKERYKLGLPLMVTGYFGYDQPIPIEGMRESNVVDKALNTPIQTGSSQVVILTVNAILDRFYEMGYTKKEVSVYFVRHDEPIFKVHKSVMKDLWVLNDFSTILVENWSPLKLSFEAGYNYGEVDEELQNEMETVYEQNLHKITILEPDVDAEEFWPVPETFTAYVGNVKLGDKMVVSIYQPSRKLVAYKLYGSDDIESVFVELQYTLLEAQEKLYDAGYRGVVVNSMLGKAERHDSIMYYRFGQFQDKHAAMSQLLANYMAARYAKREGIEFEVDLEVLNSNADSIRAVGDLNVL